MKKALFTLYMLISALLLFILSYYILVNTFFSSRALPNVKVEGEAVSFMSEETMGDVLGEDITADLSKLIALYSEDKEILLSAEPEIFELNFDEVINFGKGASFLEVLGNGVGLIDGKNINPNVSLDYDALADQLLTLRINTVSFTNFRVSCEKHTYDAEIFFDVYSSGDSNIKAIIDELNSELKRDMDAEIFKNCEKISDSKRIIEQNFGKIYSNIDIDELFELRGDVKGNLFLVVKDEKKLKKVLDEIKLTTDVSPFDGMYEIKGDVLNLFKEPQDGKSLNIEKTISAITSWINSPSSDVPLKFDDVYAREVDSSYTVHDFTQLFSEGKTRIDIIRDGRPNTRVPNAQNGILEINNQVIMPGDIFSFIGAMNFQPDGKTINGRIIGGGVCNATTTLFRAALLGGFPIRERQGHSFYVPSYEWPNDYEINIVDAAYYVADPQVDFRFINDLEYPIILKSEVYRDGSNYQYHTIRIFTSSKVEKREVVLDNWKKWNERSETLFFASFDRTVKQGGEVLRKDTFTNYYIK